MVNFISPLKTKPMEKITARFNSKCAATNKPLKKGEEIYYDRAEKKAYHISSKEAEEKYNWENEEKSLNAYIDAQENAMFERYH